MVKFIYNPWRTDLLGFVLGLRIILIRQKVTSEDFVREVKTLFNDLFYGHGLVVNLGRKLKA